MKSRMYYTVDNIIRINFTKYDRLAEEVNRAFADTEYATSSTINLYIDMYPMIHSMYSTRYEVKIDDYLAIVSNIINMCAHYREYFKRYLGVYAKIFIVAGSNCNELNRKLVLDYNKEMYMKSNNVLMDNINKMLETNLDLLNILCPYLPDIHFIKTNFETSVCINYIIQREKVANGDTSPSIIISRDPYALQLVSCNNDVSLLRPKKSKEYGDQSCMIGPIDGNNKIKNEIFWQFFSSLRSISQCNFDIAPCNLSLLMALSKLDERNIKSVFNIKSARKYIYNCIGDLNTTCQLSSLFTINKDLSDKVSELEISNRFKAINIPFQTDTVYSSSMEAKLLNFSNREDSVAVKAINDRYFSNNPLAIDLL